MTTAITFSTTTAGNNVVLADDEDVFVAANVTRISTGGDALAALFDGHEIQILGSLAGETAGLNLGAGTSAATLSRLTIGDSASVLGRSVGVLTRGSSVSVFNDGLIQGGQGLYHEGGAGFEFVNTGTVVATSGDAVLVKSNSGKIVNYGTIVSMSHGIDLLNDGGAGTFPTVDNYGTISAQGNAIWGGGSVPNIFRNFGEIHGHVRGAGGDDSIFNSGLIVGDILLGSSNDRLDSRTGTIVGDVFGAGGSDTISTGAEDNLIDGGQDADTMAGGDGGDVYIVDNAGDVIVEGAGPGSDTAKSSVSFALAGNVEALTLTDTSAINGTGNALRNVITGNSAANVLNGGLGNDVLSGGGGADRLYGGLGNDRLTGGEAKDFFVFNTPLNSSTNRDVVTDFSHVDDTIWLENAIFKAVGAGGTLSPAAFYLGTKAHDTTDRIIYNKVTGVVYYDDDGTGAHGQVQVAVLSNKPADLAYNDFVVI